MLNKLILPVLLLSTAVTFFTRNNIRSVGQTVPEVLQQPLQEKRLNTESIRFEKDGYQYELIPLYDYQISGLLVSKMDYKFLSIYKSSSVFPLDVCLLWGGNAENKVYQYKKIRFFQDCRWCNAEWEGNVPFNLNEISNNHLVFKHPRLESAARNLVAGDQIRITGKLVNVKAQSLGESESFNPASLRWNTSIVRNDTGAGACEIVYVEDLKILKKANLISRALFQTGVAGILAVIILDIFSFFMGRVVPR
ncbi:MAG: hypothetical protein PHC33_05440 [Candidatus Omnitrophica bacterium]|nr:hypothetical protein [Candidatus Omnitrophota bacterium]